MQTWTTCRGNFDEVLPGSFNAGVGTETLHQIVAEHAEAMEDIELGTSAELSEKPRSLEAGSFPPMRQKYLRHAILLSFSVRFSFFVNFMFVQLG